MKIGVLGGSFNPVHTGHVRMAVEVLEQLALDRVELMPAKTPPHKDEDGILPFDLRVALIEGAVEDIAGLEVNTVENQRPGPSFTCDTLTCFRNDRAADDFHFILGASTFLGLAGWRRGIEIPSLSSLVVVNRWEAAEAVAGFIDENWPEAKQEEEGRWLLPGGNTIHLLDIPRLDIKGGHIRQRWLKRRDLSLLVPEGVKRVLEEKADELQEFWGIRS